VSALCAAWDRCARVSDSRATLLCCRGDHDNFHALAVFTACLQITAGIYTWV
jgi:hypothetical protein